MKHRHIEDKNWTKAALFSLFERGSREDWRELALDLAKDSSGEIEQNLLKVAKETGHENFAANVIAFAKQQKSA